MAKQIARLLKTDVMADINMPALAQILRRMGRKGDTILAHITPEEAKMLEEEGGSGTINPDTGLPEYAPDDYTQMDYTEPDILPVETSPVTADYTPTPQVEPMPLDYRSYDPSVYQAGESPLPSQPIDVSQAYYAAPAAGAPQVGEFAGYMPTVGGAYQAGEFTETPSAPIAPTAADKPEFFKKQFEDLTKDVSPREKRDLLLRGALGVGTGLLGGLQARRAAQQAQQAKSDIAAIGSPYQAEGKQAMAGARRGELTAAGQQQLQAARAALAQGVERRGGVGAQQAAVQLEAFRQQLLDNQYNYGLKVAQIGDQYAQRAIQTGLTQDRQVSAGMQGLMAALGGFFGSRPNQPAG